MRKHLLRLTGAVAFVAAMAASPAKADEPDDQRRGRELSRVRCT